MKEPSVQDIRESAKALLEGQKKTMALLIAERDRYREALERIADLPNQSERKAGDYAAIAKQALAPIAKGNE